MDKVSIIIPFYNRKDVICTTIDNILNQTLFPYEIIVVDDHSSDGTSDLLKNKYGDKLTLLTNKGKGPGAARNTGFDVATGDYIKFFDSDDVMTLNTLEEQVKVLKNTQKSYVTAPYFYAIENENKWIPKDNVIINYYGFPFSNSLTYWMIWGLFLTIPGMLFRKKFLEMVGPWPEDIITSEDWEYLWRISLLEPFPAHTSECAFIYRVHDAQSTGTNFDNYSRDLEKFLVLRRIFEKDLSKKKFSVFERLLFKHKFFLMAKVTNNLNFKTQLIEMAGKGQYIIGLLYRFKMKLGRIKTKSQWQPMHGIIKDSALLEKIIKSV